MSTDINKTLILSYDEVCRMQRFCLDEDGNLSRKFLDWYLKDETFFSKCGILIVDVKGEDAFRFVLSFDFNNVEHPNFFIHEYKTQTKVCGFTFSREQNISMENVTPNVNFFDSSFFSDSDNRFMSKSIFEQKNKDLRYRISRLKKAKKGTVKKYRSLLNSALCNSTCETAVYGVYAMMYYFSVYKPKEIVGEGKKRLISIENKISAPSTYKYSGYINLDKSKIYKPIISPNKEKRDFQRHIECWSVRGHYRRLKDGRLIWIDEHKKGVGELEKRVYGTEDEKNINIRPKVFKTTRLVADKPKKSLSSNKSTNEKTSLLKRFILFIIKLYKYCVRDRM